MARVYELGIRESKEAERQSVSQAFFESSAGVNGDDLHKGSKHGVSLLAKESMDRIAAAGIDGLCTRRFYANIVTEGLDIFLLPAGAKLKVGGVTLLITQTGKPCWKSDGCAIAEAGIDCVLRNEAVFASVIDGGTIYTGDEVATA